MTPALERRHACSECGRAYETVLPDGVYAASGGIRIDRKYIPLSVAQSTILRVLLKRHQKVTATSYLYSVLYDAECEADGPNRRAVATFISRLRKKLEGSRLQIYGQLGHGYWTEMESKQLRDPKDTVSAFQVLKETFFTEGTNDRVQGDRGECGRVREERAASVGGVGDGVAATGAAADAKARAPRYCGHPTVCEFIGECGCGADIICTEEQLFSACVHCPDYGSEGCCIYDDQARGDQEPVG